MKLERKRNCRAWIAYKHEMIDVYDFVRLAVPHSNEDDFQVIEDDGCGKFSKYDNFELMESTGLKDKNGVEIFEGDIIRFKDYDGWEWTADVVWCPELAYFGISFGGGYPLTFEDMKEFYTELKDVEVVGNIYETNIL